MEENLAAQEKKLRKIVCQFPVQFAFSDFFKLFI
jgi:hypothetical protein